MNLLMRFRDIFGPPDPLAPRTRSNVKRLLKTLKHCDDYTRETSVEMLARLGDADAFGPLVSAMNDPSAGVRIAAAAALRKLDSERATKHLVAALARETDERALLPAQH